LLQFQKGLLRILEFPPGNKVVGSLQSLPKPNFPLPQGLGLPNLPQKAGGLGIRRIELKGSLKLTLRRVPISPAQGPLAGTQGLTDLPQTVALLQRPLLQRTRFAILWIQPHGFTESADGFRIFTLMEGVLALLNELPRPDERV
jgi:hypothetical protein